MESKKIVLSRRSIMQTGAIVGLVSVFVVFLVILIFTGRFGLAFSAGIIVAGVGAVVLLLLFLLVSRSERAAKWMTSRWELAEQDIDPGLELLAAGILVYRMGEIRPDIHFRKVPLGNARAIRPFIVARTGAERPHSFHFALTDDQDEVRFKDRFTVDLGDKPRLVMPAFRIAPDMPRKLVGQCWTLQVRSKMTVVTSFRFMFIDHAERLDALGGVSDDPTDQALERHHVLLPQLLDEEIKREVMVTTQEIVLEDL